MRARLYYTSAFTEMQTRNIVILKDFSKAASWMVLGELKTSPKHVNYSPNSN